MDKSNRQSIFNKIGLNNRNLLVFITLLLLATESLGNSIDRTIQKHGLDAVASALAAQVRKTLPARKDKVTTHVDSKYYSGSRTFTFDYHLDDNMMEEAKKYPGEKLTEQENLTLDLMEDHIFEITLQTIKDEDHIPYFCSNDIYRSLMNYGMTVKVTHVWKEKRRSFSINEEDC